MKKVLFMLSSMDIGGVEKSLLSLLSVMPKEAYDVKILLLEEKGAFLDHLPDWVRVEEASWYQEVKPIIMQSPYKTIKDFYAAKTYSRIPSFVYSYLISEKVLKDRYIYYKHIFKSVPLHEEDYDIAVAYQGPTDIIDYYVGHHVNAVKKISWVHFDVSKHSVNTKLYQQLYQRFDMVLVVSNEAHNHLVDKIPSVKFKSDVCKNIVSKTAIKVMSKETADFDKEYTGRIIVTVGRLSWEKGQDMAIAVLSWLREEGYDVKWYCVGGGKQRAEYEQMIEGYGLKDHFILTGPSPNPYPYIAQADIYVQPSRHEGYCLSLAEAKCLQRPIVTTDFTGANEQIIDGYNGLISKCNADALYYHVKYLLAHPDQADKLALNLSATKDDRSSTASSPVNMIQ
ncbi:Glycosyltransferase involved in cell wall bisynthesis [Lentibacillus persicus]|uniref:Glycosyltransferase involved in cell wall bisynthesis n=1 Tax=Lentibacillus persicus TaxID=640948 RepID=A0A1I1U8F2_9BACI|nr:glycosyltransferase [Lentibacillus persicus]SFD66925.1 Glycosyltransferase involved in cell wall bisynthesis [Lentibacillus persicus]